MRTALSLVSTVGAAALLWAAPTAAAGPVAIVAGDFRPPAAGCSRQPGANAFLAALSRAVARHDAAGFVALTAPDVRLDFGGGAGRAQLTRRLAGPEGGKLWRELDRLLPLGCAVQEGNLVLPAVFARDFGELDPFEVMVVTGERVPLLSAPNPGAKPVRLLSWVAVTALSGDDYEKPFRHVRLLDGKATGYVATAKLRSPLDYRLVAARSRGVWKIDAFVAGD